jgi:hypothetical protein
VKTCGRRVSSSASRDDTPPLLTQTEVHHGQSDLNVPPSIIRNEYLPVSQQDRARSPIGLRIGRNADGSIRIYQPPGEKMRSAASASLLIVSWSTSTTRRTRNCRQERTGLQPRLQLVRSLTSTPRCCCRSRSRKSATPQPASAASTAWRAHHQLQQLPLHHLSDGVRRWGREIRDPRGHLRHGQGHGGPAARRSPDRGRPGRAQL